MSNFEGKRASLVIEEPDQLQKITHALSSKIRVRMMEALARRSLNIGELANELSIPMSTAALSVKILEQAGIVTVEAQPGTRGLMKIVSRKLDHIEIDLAPRDESPRTCLELAMPIGGYSSAEDIHPTCGLAGADTYIGEMDTASGFYLPNRFGAQLIWFQQGFLEYRFSAVGLNRLAIDWLELSFEACSEAPMYRDPWHSDIAVEVNNRRLGIWTSPCDCGGRRGMLTPAWWSDVSTQFGFLKTWRVDDTGTYLDNDRIGSTTLKELALQERPYIGVRIGIPADAENIGGLNLFGEGFGDYPQGLVLRIGYHFE